MKAAVLRKKLGDLGEGRKNTAGQRFKTEHGPGRKGSSQVHAISVGLLICNAVVETGPEQTRPMRSTPWIN